MRIHHTVRYCGAGQGGTEWGRVGRRRQARAREVAGRISLVQMIDGGGGWGDTYRRP